MRKFSYTSHVFLLTRKNNDTEIGVRARGDVKKLL